MAGSSSSSHESKCSKAVKEMLLSALRMTDAPIDAAGVFLENLCSTIRNIQRKNRALDDIGFLIIKMLSNNGSPGERIRHQRNARREDVPNDESVRVIYKLKDLDELIKKLQTKKDYIYNVVLGDSNGPEPEEEHLFNADVIIAAANNHQAFFPKVEPDLSPTHPETGSSHGDMNNSTTMNGHSESLRNFTVGDVSFLVPTRIMHLSRDDIITQVKVTPTRIVCGCLNGWVALYSFHHGEPYEVMRLHATAVTAICLWGDSIITSSLDGFINSFLPGQLITKRCSNLCSAILTMVIVERYLFVGTSNGCLHKLDPDTLVMVVPPLQINRGILALSEINFNGCPALGIICIEGSFTIRSIDCDILMSVELPGRATTMTTIPINGVPHLFVGVSSGDSVSQICILFQDDQDYYKLEFVDNVHAYGSVVWYDRAEVLRKNGPIWIQNRETSRWYRVVNISDEITGVSAYENLIAYITAQGRAVLFELPRDIIVAF